VLGFHGSAALLPRFIDAWHLSATEAGWLLGVMSLCALLASPAIALTDRVDARRVMIAGTLVNAVGYAGFGLFADGLPSALFFRGMLGVGYALSYMPGIKALGDRIAPQEQARATSTYVSSFSVCSSLSVVIAGTVADEFGWRWAFAVPAASNLLAGAMLFVFLPPAHPHRSAVPATPGSGAQDPPVPGLFDFRAIIANRAAMGFVAGGFAHTVELLALRGWTVAFLGFVATLHPGTAPDWNLSLVATLLILLGVPSGIVGGMLASRLGLARVAVTVMLLSALTSAVVGFAASWPYWLFFLGPLVIHNVLVMADGGSLSAGVMSRADPRRRGSTVAFYTMCGSVGSFVGPVLFGAVLDAAGGRQSATAWGFAFASIGVVSLASALTLHRLARR
jgi:MFS family permease